MDSNLKWSKKDLDEVDAFLNSSKNEKIIRFNNFNFPQESKFSHDDLIFKTYCYPHQGEHFKGVIFLVHGFTDYVGRFAHVAQYLSELGYDFHGMDQRGHG